MKLELYKNTQSFGRDVLDILLENEVQNNLPIGFIKNERGFDTSNWFLSTVKDDAGSIVLIAACTPPHNLVLYETGNRPNDAAVKFLSNEIKCMGIVHPGVLAEQGLARRFAETHVGTDGYYRHESLIVMRLDKVSNIYKAPGICRPLCEDDLFFAPYWQVAFGEECHLGTSDISYYIDNLKKRIEKDIHFIWEDRIPVSQAAHGRSTVGGAVIGSVYTPPHYRGKGYASSCVAEVSQILLERGNKFCCLFANAENPISCGIYHKLGYRDLCVFEELRFYERVII